MHPDLSTLEDYRMLQPGARVLMVLFTVRNVISYVPHIKGRFQSSIK